MVPVSVEVWVTVRRVTVAIDSVGCAPPLSCAPLAMLNPSSATVARHARDRDQPAERGHLPLTVLTHQTVLSASVGERRAARMAG